MSSADPTVIAALKGATVAKLRNYARYMERVEDHLDANGPLLATDTREELHGMRECYRTLAGLALAVAEMQDHGAFVDGGAMPWTMALGNSLLRDVVNDAPTLPAALAAMLEAK